MTNQGCRSKNPVVRLEPFFAAATVAPHEGPVGNAPNGEVRPKEEAFQAAFGLVLPTAAAVASNRTDTRFDTPDSSIVTP